MPATPTTEPTSLIAGDTARWLKSLPSYPASDGWVLSYTLVNAATRLVLPTTADGDSHQVSVPAATTAAWPAGNYDYRAAVTRAGDVFTVAAGRMTIQPAFGAAIDTRSHARRTLAAIESTLEGRASSATAEYEIADRQMKYIPLPELLTLRDRYRRDVREEERAAGIGLSGRIHVRFGP